MIEDAPEPEIKLNTDYQFRGETPIQGESGFQKDWRPYVGKICRVNEVINDEPGTGSWFTYGVMFDDGTEAVVCGIDLLSLEPPVES